MKSDKDEIFNALQQLVATAIKHSATEVIIRLDFGFTQARFKFEGSREVLVEISVPPKVLFDYLCQTSESVQKTKQGGRSICQVEVNKLNVRFKVAWKNLKDSSPKSSEEYYSLFDFQIEEKPSKQVYQTIRGQIQPVNEAIDERLEIPDDFFSETSAKETVQSSQVFRSAKAENYLQQEISESTPPEKAQVSVSAKRVLVIEDDQDQQTIIKKVLELEGYLVDLASDGIDGILKATTTNPDIILIDFMMPDIDGYETIKRLRKTPQVSKIPIIALTAYHNAEIEYNLLDAGANDFCEKSIAKKVLIKRIEKLLSRD